MPTPLFDGLGDALLNIFENEFPAIFKPIVGSSQPIKVIFNARHQQIDFDGKSYGAEKPIAWIRTGLINPKFNDIIEIDGKDYFIKDDEPDGLEITKLLLAEKI